MNIKDVSCPECDNRLKLGNHLHKGQRITCPECESKLIVVNLRPVELESAQLVNRSTKLAKKANIIEIACPECDNLIRLNARTHRGQYVLCNSCNTPFEVVDTNPLELDIAFDTNIKSTYLKNFSREQWREGQ